MTCTITSLHPLFNPDPYSDIQTTNKSTFRSNPAIFDFPHHDYPSLSHLSIPSRRNHITSDPHINQPSYDTSTSHESEASPTLQPILKASSCLSEEQNIKHSQSKSKKVGFSDEPEVRQFYANGSPSACGSDTNLLELQKQAEEQLNGEWQLISPCEPVETDALARREAQLIQWHLSEDKTRLVVTVAVRNIAYEKQVSARFTFHDWKIASEVKADHSSRRSTKSGLVDYDEFDFAIELPIVTVEEEKTIELCIQYRVAGQEFWDNNNQRNYRVNIRGIPARSPPDMVAGTLLQTVTMELMEGYESGQPLDVRTKMSSPGLSHRYNLDSSLARLYIK